MVVSKARIYQIPKWEEASGIFWSHSHISQWSQRGDAADITQQVSGRAYPGPQVAFPHSSTWPPTPSCNARTCSPVVKDNLSGEQVWKPQPTTPHTQLCLLDSCSHSPFTFDWRLPWNNNLKCMTGAVVYLANKSFTTIRFLLSTEIFSSVQVSRCQALYRNLRPSTASGGELWLV